MAADRVSLSSLRRPGGRMALSAEQPGPNNQGPNSEGVWMAELEPVLLPVTVAASHLQACAGALADAPDTALDDLVAVLGDVVHGQRHLAEAFAALAERVRHGRDDGRLDAATPVDVTAFAEVLQAAATAFGCSAEALSAGRPLARRITEMAGGDTRL